ncbi:hypothetical protein MMC25_006515, partial [Agyrium rufum]|nr:hypothetical protein [Agyrium rufum]
MSAKSDPPSRLGLRQRLSHRFSRSRSPASPFVVPPTTSTQQISLPQASAASPAAQSSQPVTILSATSISISAPSTISPLPASSISEDILRRTLQRLTEDERNVIKKYLPTNAADISSTLDAVLSEAQKSQKECERKTTAAGPEFSLRDRADKIIRWLDRFKAVGDIAVNADPIHAGLPWAGIRLILEIATANANERAALLDGCETVLDMAHRLKAYMEFLSRLPVSLPRTNFEAALVAFYAHMFWFLAEAIRICQKSTLHRSFSALWDSSKINDFKTRTRDLERGTETGAEMCSRDQQDQDRRNGKRRWQDLMHILQQLDQIRGLQDSIDQLRNKIDLDKIPYVEGAFFDAHEDGDSIRTTCHPETRVDILYQSRDWMQDKASKLMFWLNGAAGTGKSTISQTVARWLSDQRHSRTVQLGASFFFKRGEGDRGTAKKFFPTIVRQLVINIPELCPLVADAIRLDPLLFGKSLATQFEYLVERPLQHVTLRPTCCSMFVVVVDALDECNSTQDIKTILDLWLRLESVTTIRLRLFLTSRPELPIRLKFRKMLDGIHKDVILHDVPKTVIRHDIMAFLRDEFSKIREDHNSDISLESILPSDWPGDEILQKLAEKSIPLFIVAATICRFVGDRNWNAPDRLQTIQKFQALGQKSQMEQIYLPILTQISASLSDPRDAEQFYEEFRTIIGSIVVLTNALSISSLSILLGQPQDTIKRRLDPLHSVLKIPTSSNDAVRPLHLSFSEFLLSEDRRNESFGVNGPATHKYLLGRCLELLSGPNGLRENICKLKYPGCPRSDVEAPVIVACLSAPVQYACRYWVHHAKESKILQTDDDRIYGFLRSHFLHWLEALSLMGIVSDAIDILKTLQSILSPENCSDLYNFLEDAYRFILANRHMADIAPLQLYSSAVMFAPQMSVVRNMCGRVPSWIHQTPITPSAWGSVLQILEGHTRSVNAVTFSTDGSLIASASEDQT